MFEACCQRLRHLEVPVVADTNASKISQCLSRFRSHDPALYQELIRNVSDYSTELTVAVTEVPPELVMEARGRAQAARKFLQLFTQLPKI